MRRTPSQPTATPLPPLRDADRRPVLLGETVGQGGEAQVSAVAGRPDLVAKVYREALPPGYDAKLRWMVAHPLHDTGGVAGHVAVAWPQSLLHGERGEVRGFLMPRVPGARPMIEAFNPKRRSTALPGFDRRYLHRTGRNLAAALAAVHAAGHVVGDLNESNALVTPSALVSLIDTDSFQVRGTRDGREVVWPCPVGKPEYTPPELQGVTLGTVERSAPQDRFALGVLLWQLLMEGSHPFRVLWKGSGEPPDLETAIRIGAFPHGSGHPMVAPPPGTPAIETLHPALAVLFRRCFVDGHRDPSARPTPEAWAQAIGEAERDLRPCGRGHHHAGHLPACPYCAMTTAIVRAPMPPPPVAVDRPRPPTRPTPARTGSPPLPLAPTQWQRNAPPPRRAGNTAIRILMAIMAISFLAQQVTRFDSGPRRSGGDSAFTSVVDPGTVIFRASFDEPARDLPSITSDLTGTVGDGALTMRATATDGEVGKWVSGFLAPAGNAVVEVRLDAVGGSGSVDVILGNADGQEVHLLGRVGGTGGGWWTVATSRNGGPLDPYAALESGVDPTAGPVDVALRVVNGRVRVFLNGEEATYPPGANPVRFNGDLRVGVGLQHRPTAGVDEVRVTVGEVTVRDLGG